MKAFFTGHRDLPKDRIPEITELVDKTINELYERGITFFTAGGAYGFDMLAECRVLRFKKEHPEVKLKIILPFKDSDARWSEELRNDQKKILALADEVVENAPRYYRTAYTDRDRQLVLGSDVCVAFLNKQTGGTYYTYCYAKRLEMELINIAEMMKL